MPAVLSGSGLKALLHDSHETDLKMSFPLGPRYLILQHQHIQCGKLPHEAARASQTLSIRAKLKRDIAAMLLLP